MKTNGSRRQVDIAVTLAGDGRIQLVSRYFFADPTAEVCRQLVGRLFEVNEVRAVEVIAGRARAEIEYTNGVVPWREVVGKIGRRLQNGHDGAPDGGPSPELPEMVDGAAGWRLERRGARLSTWQVRHELPGRIRFHNRLVHRDAKACRAIERALARTPGILRCTASRRTGTVLVVFEPARFAADTLVVLLDRALLDARRPDHLAAGLSDLSRAPRPELAPTMSSQRWSSVEFMVSSGSLAMAIAGALVYPPLGLLSVPAQIYVTRGVYLHGVRKLVRNRTLTVDLLVTGLQLVTLAHGYFVLFSLGNFVYLITKNLLDKVKQDSRADYTDIFRQQARSVWVRVDGAEVELPLEAVKIGDVVAIAAGQTIPVDGRVVEGAATVDQHVMTGEAIPAEKGVGDAVLALTVVLSGKIFVRVEKTGPATAAAHIAQVLDRTVDFKTGRQLGAERLADRLLMPAALSALFTWPLLGAGAGAALLDAHPKYKTTLASSIGLLNYFNIAARQGLLIKDGRTLELLNGVDTVVFDKTGTLTLAQPRVARLYACAPRSAAEVLGLAAAAEQHQSHPIAAAILQAARVRGLSLPVTREADYRVGYGLTVTIDGAAIRVGSLRFMEMHAVAVPPALLEVQARCHDEGHSLVLVAVDGALAGAVELHTAVRPEARRIVDGLRRRGITSMYVISGDHETPTRRLAETLGIDHYFAETLPENKASLIEGLVGDGRVICYVGDGINDSIAMKKSHVSVSLRGASTVATDTAEVILLDQSLGQLCALFDLAHACNRNMRVTMAAVLVPCVVCLGGVLLGSIAFMGGRVLNYVSLGLGVGAAMVPLVTARAAGWHVTAPPPDPRAAEVEIEERLLA